MDHDTVQRLGKLAFEHDALADRLNAIPFSGPPGSASADDLAYGAKRGAYVGMYARQAIAAALDHLLALRILLERGPMPTNAPWTIVRGIMENASRALWHLQPDVSAVRLARGYAARKDDQLERRRHDQGSGSRLPLGVSGMTAQQRLDLLEEDRIAGGVGCVEYQDTTSLLAARGLERAWRTASAYAHAKEWQVPVSRLERLSEGPPGTTAALISLDEKALLEVAEPTVGLLRDAIQALERYQQPKPDKKSLVNT